MSLLDSFTWAPGQGMLDVAKNTSYQAGAARDFAQTDLVNTENSQKQAELQDYISQSAKDLRETTRQAAIGKAKEEVANSEALSNYFKNNPDARNEMTALKAHKEITGMSKDISDNEAAIEHTSTAKWYDPIAGKADTAAYLKERPNMIKNGVGTEKDLPTAEDLQNNPEALTALNRAGAASFYTQEQIAARAAAKTKAEAELKQQNVQDANALARTKLMQEEEMKRTKYVQDATNTRWANRDQAKVDAAAKKAEAQKNGKAMKISEFGAEDKQFYDGSLVVDDVLDKTGANLDSQTKQIVKVKLWAAAKSEYAAQAKMFENGEISTHPSDPQDIYIAMAEQAAKNPKQLEKGLPVIRSGKIDIERPETTAEVQTKVEKPKPKTGADVLKQEEGLVAYKSHAMNKPKEGTGLWADKDYNKKLDAWKQTTEKMLKGSGYNDAQIRMMQDDDFLAATKEEQKTALEYLNK